jgi:hypothetical protein
MSVLPPNIDELIDAEKSFSVRPRWDDQSDPRYFTFLAPLSTGEETIGGFEVRAKVSKEFVNRDAFMQLEFATTGRSREELWRCQWRPFETHTNKAWGPPGFVLARFVNESHHHPFWENWIAAERRMRGGSLPAALPLMPDPATLSGFLDFCGNCFRIKNMNLVELPGGPDLFWSKDG